MAFLAFFLLVAILIVSFLFSNYFRLKNAYSGSDAFFHYQAAEQLRKNKLRLYKQMEPYALPSPPDYPPLLHYLLALLPPHQLISYGRFIGSLFDALTKILLFFMARLLTQEDSTALLAVALYSLIVITVEEQVEASPRSIGNFVFVANLFSLLLYMYTSHLAFLVIPVVCVFLSYIIHRFSFQVTVLTLLFLSIYLQNPFFILVLVAGVLLSMLVLRTYFFLLLKSMASTYTIWFSMRNVKKTAKEGYSKLSVFVFEFFLSNLMDLLVLFLVFVMNYALPPQLAPFFIVMVFLRCVQIAVYFVKYLKCIGEHFRYLGYNAAFTSLCLASLLYLYPTDAFVIGSSSVVGVTSVVAIVFWQRAYRKSKFLFPDQATIESLKKITKIPTGLLLVLDYPYSRNVGFLTKKKLFYTSSQQYFHLVREMLWPTAPLSETIKQNNITHVLVHLSVEKRYELPHVKPIYKDDQFVLYRVL